MSENLLKTVGLAARARKITFGSDMTAEGIKSGKVKLVLITTDASANSEKKILRCCEENGIAVFRIPMGSGELAVALGKNKPLVTVGITDDNLAIPVRNKLLELDSKILTVSESEVN